MQYFLIGETTATMDGLMTDATTILTKLLALATQVLDWIVAHPLTLMGFLLGVIGLSIGLVMKFRH